MSANDNLVYMNNPMNRDSKIKMDHAKLSAFRVKKEEMRLKKKQEDTKRMAAQFPLIFKQEAKELRKNPLTRSLVKPGSSTLYRSSKKATRESSKGSFSHGNDENIPTNVMKNFTKCLETPLKKESPAVVIQEVLSPFDGNSRSYTTIELGSITKRDEIDGISTIETVSNLTEKFEATAPVFEDLETQLDSKIQDLLKFMYDEREVDEVIFRRLSDPKLSQKFLKRLSITPRTSNQNERLSILNFPQSDSVVALDPPTLPSDQCVVEPTYQSLPPITDQPLTIEEVETTESMELDMQILNALREFVVTEDIANTSDETHLPVDSIPLTPCTEENIQIEDIEKPCSPSTTPPTEEVEPIVMATIHTFSNNPLLYIMNHPEFEVTAEHDHLVLVEASAKPSPAVTESPPMVEIKSIESSPEQVEDVKLDANSSDKQSKYHSLLEDLFSPSAKVSNANESMDRSNTLFSPNITTECIKPQRRASTGSSRRDSIVNKHLIRYPLSDLLDRALIKGLVVAELVDRVLMADHVKYVIQVQIISIPGVSDDEECENFHATLFRRYSEFKTFHQELVKAVDMRCPSSGGSFFPENIMPLPSKQIVELGCQPWKLDSFLDSRQYYLQNWLNSVFQRQSTEDNDYREELKRFIIFN